MPYKCCIVNCRSNYDDGEKEAVFSFPDEEKEFDLRQRWVKFVNRKDWSPTKTSVICRKHFEPRYVKTGDKGLRHRLVKESKPVPTIFDPNNNNNSNNASSSSSVSHLKAPVSLPRRSPKKRVFQKDQQHIFAEQDKINCFGDIDQTLTPY